MTDTRSNPTLNSTAAATPGAPHASAPAMAVTPVNYRAAAELFSSRNRKSRGQLPGYRRFAHAADAIRFAVEELPPSSLLGAYLEVEEARYDSRDIMRLYESADFPLARRAAA